MFIQSLLETGTVSPPPPSATSPTSKALSTSLGAGAHAHGLTLCHGADSSSNTLLQRRPDWGGGIHHQKEGKRTLNKQNRGENVSDSLTLG